MKRNCARLRAFLAGRFEAKVRPLLIVQLLIVALIVLSSDIFQQSQSPPTLPENLFESAQMKILKASTYSTNSVPMVWKNGVSTPPGFGPKKACAGKKLDQNGQLILKRDGQAMLFPYPCGATRGSINDPPFCGKCLQNKDGTGWFMCRGTNSGYKVMPGDCCYEVTCSNRNIGGSQGEGISFAGALPFWLSTHFFKTSNSISP